jgi:hypothetical protein
VNKNVFPIPFPSLTQTPTKKKKEERKKKTVPPGFRRYASFDSRQHHSGAAGTATRAASR